MSYEVKVRVDARGSFCPGPLMELVKAIKKVEVGDVVELLSADEGSKKDIPVWIEKAGHELLEIKEYGDHAGFVVKKGEKKRRR